MIKIQKFEEMEFYEILEIVRSVTEYHKEYSSGVYVNALMTSGRTRLNLPKLNRKMTSIELHLFCKHLRRLGWGPITDENRLGPALWKYTGKRKKRPRIKKR